jgi:hypothetical protein
MKINIPQVIVPIDMAEYAPEMAGSFLHVWVNPSLDMLTDHFALATSIQNGEVLTLE